ncbi:hypothetical protein EXIGLDRAFT_747023 [Exidia glandulosa HHB12029]|uniref:Uncharacterized protein n=1 Tax=Exidia glandulosa HHB12029 TaxID=1314781 RepID=A0A165L8H2_EXIGL|nr:hypothetical protein EXIGLDRAFT_747023 [Exidia glandulosa HHB12029]
MPPSPPRRDDSEDEEDLMPADKISPDEQARERVKLEYQELPWDPFHYAKTETFAGNEDSQLLSHCLRLHELLATLQEHDILTKDEHAAFVEAWNQIRNRSGRLPPPTRAITGQDNSGRPYTVVGKANWRRKRSCYVECREYDDGLGMEINFGLLEKNYFYRHPEGDFYGSYTLKGGDHKSIKLSALEVKRYHYPPDIPSRERGGKADRFY